MLLFKSKMDQTKCQEHHLFEVNCDQSPKIIRIWEFVNKLKRLTWSFGDSGQGTSQIDWSPLYNDNLWSKKIQKQRQKTIEIAKGLWISLNCARRI